MKKNRSFIFGLILIVVGLIFTMNIFGLFKFNIFFDGWWTLIIIIPSLINVFKDEDKVGSIFGIIIGSLLLLSCQKIIDFSIIWKLLFPIIIILIGLKLVLNSFKVKKKNKRISKADIKNMDSSCATFSSKSVTYTDEEFFGIELDAIFGEIKCDLTKANIKDGAIIDASSIFGSVEIKVKENVNIEVVSSSIFGGVENKNNNNNETNEVTLYVYANCLFGGVKIK